MLLAEQSLRGGAGLDVEVRMAETAAQAGSHGLR
jgi:hypothetical protein